MPHSVAARRFPPHHLVHQSCPSACQPAFWRRGALTCRPPALCLSPTVWPGRAAMPSNVAPPLKEAVGSEKKCYFSTFCHDCTEAQSSSCIFWGRQTLGKTKANDKFQKSSRCSSVCADLASTLYLRVVWMPQHSPVTTTYPEYPPASHQLTIERLQ